MKPAPIESDEANRLAALLRYQILDTLAEAAFDDFTKLASHICATPIALISLVDADRQWFKSRVGLDATQTPRDISFCGHAIHGREVFEVPNALHDERFCDNPLVTSAPDIRFYAGAPLVTPDGHGIGTLCVIDRVEHHLTDAQRDALTALGRQVVAQLELGLALRREITQAQSLEGLSERLALATQAGDIGVWDYDPVSGKLIWDDTMYRLYRLASADFEGAYHAWSSRVHPLDRSATEAMLARALRGEGEYSTTFRIQLADGEVRYIKASGGVQRDHLGQAVRMIGTNQDVTEQVRADAALQDQAHYTQAILDNVIDGIITIDERGQVASLNKAAETIFGYSPAEVIGHNVKMLMPEPYHSEHDSYLANYRATGVERVIGMGREVTGLRKIGDTFPMELAVSQISHKGSRMFVGLVRDITERRRMEQMKTEFVSTVSHELRTPLTSISGALGLLMGGAMGELPQSMKPLIEIAHNNSQRLSHLINDLLDMEKIAAGKMHFDMQKQPLMPLVEQALESNKAYGAQRGVLFALLQRVEGALVLVDGQRLAQVLANFLSNAAKYSPEGGQVEVCVSQHGSRVRVLVRDHGPGVPAAFRDRIFQKFSQADSSDTRQKGGTGLGLAITKELVEHMGGVLGFDSEEGHGASFWFELPIQDAAEPSGPSPHRRVTDGANANAPRILVVEDDPDIAHLLSLMLSRAGYRTVIAQTGEAALALLAEGDLSAMTLDLMLPGMSGLQVIDRVRNDPSTASFPIIVVSAKLEDGKLAIDGDFAGIEWLPKPIDEKRLHNAVAHALPNGQPGESRVLHVEDDVDLHHVIRAMVGERFALDHAASLAQARDALALRHYDVVILDLSLPDGSGWELLPIIRAYKPAPRVIVLSGAELSSAEIHQVESALLKSRVSPQALLDALDTYINKTGSYKND